jgi:dTDP-4-dehydrorhamnose reductase
LEDKLRVLIIGASGKVGKEIFKILKNKDNKSTYDVSGTYYTNQMEGLEQLDITNLPVVEKFLEKINPSILIHTAAISHPLRCEENRELAWKINVEGTKNIAQYCIKNSCKMVFISSDGVFNGKNGPFDETHKTNPLNYYGETKVESEKIVSEINDYLVIRTAWVNDVGPNSRSFVMQVINSLQNGNVFNAPIDQFGHPTYSTNLAEIIIELIKNNYNGIFHVTGSTYIDRFHFAKKIAKAFDLNPEMIHEITTDLIQSRTRPMKVKMKLDKLKSSISTKILSLDEQLDSMRNNYHIV